MKLPEINKRDKWLLDRNYYIDRDDQNYFVLPRLKPSNATAVTALGTGKTPNEAIDAAMEAEQ